ncbi:MAG: PTS lactose/cellobiose transporter subunit IIA [Sarcina sp.]
MEEIIMNLIMYSGQARSYCMDAIQLAKSGNIVVAQELIENATQELGKAHQSQTGLIQNESAGNKSKVTLLLVHAQDHLMTSITVKDLAIEIIELYSRIV